MKELERRIDGLLTPKSSKSIHWVPEIQMQKAKPEEDIYHRLALEVALLSLRNPNKKYRGILIFGDPSCDSKTRPWYSDWQQDSSDFQIHYLEELLKKLSEKEPDHPLVLLFKPFYSGKKPGLAKELSQLQFLAQKGLLPEEGDLPAEKYRSKLASLEEKLKTLLQKGPRIKFLFLLASISPGPIISQVNL